MSEGLQPGRILGESGSGVEAGAAAASAVIVRVSQSKEVKKLMGRLTDVEWKAFVAIISDLARVVGAASPKAERLEALIYDGYAVYSALDERAKSRTSPDNVSDVLDALARLTLPLPSPASNGASQEEGATC